MTDDPTLANEPDAQQTQEIAATKRASWWRRPGCLIGLAVWLAIAIFVLLVMILLLRDEITISQGDAPNQQIRIWLISEPDQRGIGLSRTSVHDGAENEAMCIQTHVNFLMWQGDENNSINYCECYAEIENADNLQLTRADSGLCTAAE